MPHAGTLALLMLAALLAGFVDAVVGGGGLISVPALMLGLPAGTPITTILGTNKMVSISGTTFAAGQFVRARVLKPREVLLPMLMAMAGAALGVAMAYYLQGRFEPYVRPLLLGLMVAMLAFTLVKPGLGHLHAPRYGLAHQRLLTAVMAALLGFYDGFFGPGTGAILIFLFVTVLGFDFLRASAMAKSLNWSSNLASVSLFIWRGSYIPQVALAMAMANATGGYLGARTALAKGSAWVRLLFIGVVTALILRLAWQVR